MRSQKLISVLTTALLLCACAASAQVTFGGVGGSGGGGGAPVINSGPPPNCSVGVPYTLSSSASGGQLPYVWSTTPSTPVPGLGTINAASGVLGGGGASCTTPGNFPFTLTVCGANSLCSSVPVTIAVLNTLQINPGTFPVGIVGTPYTTSPLPTASGGTQPYTWSCPGCTYPTGLGPINSSTGVIAGSNPTTAGTTNLTIKVTDAVGSTATQAQSITINSGSTTCGPPGYLCSSTLQTVIQAPPPPFTTNVGVNQIRCDPSINGPCLGTGGIDPIVRATDSTTTTDGVTTYKTGFTIDPSSGAGENIFSSDDSKVMLIPQNTGAGCVVGFTPSTMHVTTTCTPIPNSHSISWSRTNPNVLYSMNNGGTGNPSPKLWATTFTSPTTFTQAVVVDPLVSCAALIPAGTYTAGAVSVSHDDSIIDGVLVTSGQNSVGYIFAYNQNTQQCSALYSGAATNLNNLLLFNGTLGNATFPCTPIGLHNSNILQNGTFARITTGAIPSGCTNTPLVWQVGTTNVYTCATNPSGHNANGWNIETIISNPTFFFADITAPAATYCANLLSQTYGSGLGCQNSQCSTVDIENHFGANHLSAAETEPIFVGTACANCPTTQWVAPTINEAWAFQRSPFKIQRFTHLFNSSTVLCPTCDFREVNGIITQSQTGKFGAFCSSMVLSLGSTSNGARIDVFFFRAD